MRRNTLAYRHKSCIYFSVSLQRAFSFIASRNKCFPSVRDVHTLSLRGTVAVKNVRQLQHKYRLILTLPIFHFNILQRVMYVCGNVQQCSVVTITRRTSSITLYFTWHWYSLKDVHWQSGCRLTFPGCSANNRHCAESKWPAFLLSKTPELLEPTMEEDGFKSTCISICTDLLIGTLCETHTFTKTVMTELSTSVMAFKLVLKLNSVLWTTVIKNTLKIFDKWIQMIFSLLF